MCCRHHWPQMSRSVPDDNFPWGPAISPRNALIPHAAPHFSFVGSRPPACLLSVVPYADCGPHILLLWAILHEVSRYCFLSPQAAQPFFVLLLPDISLPVQLSVICCLSCLTRPEISVPTVSPGPQAIPNTQQAPNECLQAQASGYLGTWTF